MIKGIKNPEENSRIASIGYVCPKCDKLNIYPMCIFAHYHELTMHTCECGNKVIILKGEAEEVQE